MNGKERQVAVFINVLHEREQQIIFRQIEICNYHLAREFVEEQVCNDLLRARTFRTLKPGEALKPKFKFVSSIYSAVYEGERRIVHRGNWDKTHGEIAVRAGLGYYDLFSGEIFCLRAIPQAMIFVFSHSDDIDETDLLAMNEAGYLVMDEKYRWMVLDRTSPTGISHLLSPITPDYARI